MKYTRNLEEILTASLYPLQWTLSLSRNCTAASSKFFSCWYQLYLRRMTEHSDTCCAISEMRYHVIQIKAFILSFLSKRSSSTFPRELVTAEHRRRVKNTKEERIWAANQFESCEAGQNILPLCTLDSHLHTHHFVVKYTLLPVV